MKQLVLLLFALFLGNSLWAQGRLSGTAERTASNIGGHRYTRVDWQVSYRFEVQGNQARLVFSDPQVVVNPASAYRVEGNSYTKADLGLSRWPSYALEPCNLTVSIKVRHNGKIQEAIGSDFGCDGSARGEGSTYDLREGGMPTFVSVVGMQYNDPPDEDVFKLIYAKKNGTPASAPSGTPYRVTASTPSGTPSGTLSGATATAAESTAPMPAVMLGRVATTSPPTPSTFERNLQTTTAVLNAATPFINELAAAAERRRAENLEQWKAEQAQYNATRFENANARFKTLYYDKYITKAEQGDEAAQMLLYFASAALQASKYTADFSTQRRRWFTAAFAKDNVDALVAVGALDLKEEWTPQHKSSYNALAVLEKAAALGSVDALLILAHHYDMKAWGNDAAKAFAYYTQAAEAGSPTALYTLGKIYRDGTTNKSAAQIVVKYNDPKGMNLELSEKTAFQYFLASYNPQYQASLYGKSGIASFMDRSRYEMYCLSALADFYEAGRVVPKDKSKAKALRKELADAIETDRQNSINALPRNDGF